MKVLEKGKVAGKEWKVKETRTRWACLAKSVRRDTRSRKSAFDSNLMWLPP